MTDTQPAAENNTMGRRVQGCRNNCQAARIGCGEHGVSPDSYYKRQRHISTMATTAVPHFVRLHHDQVPRFLLLFISAGQLNAKQHRLTVLGDGQLPVLLKGRFVRIIPHSSVSVGRPDARYHDLRHSYAVAAISSGIDIKTVQGNLDHATAAFALDVYGHVTDRMKRESADKLETFIRRVSES